MATIPPGDPANSAPSPASIDEVRGCRREEEAIVILVVEDNERLQALFRSVLESAGFAVGIAASGVEALACLRGAALTHLVLLDLALPDMTGLELAEALKAEPGLAGIPILLVSGMPLAEVGDLPMLLKPVGPDDLLAAVRYHAGRSHR